MLSAGGGGMHSCSVCVLDREHVGPYSISTTKRKKENQEAF